MSDSSLKCAYPACNEKVIGQCRGYGSKCGSYYCASHSTDGRCYICATQAQETEQSYVQRQAIRELIDLYSEIAEQSPGKTHLTAFFWSMFFSLIVWGILELVTAWGLVVGAAVFLLLLSYINVSSERRETIWLAEMNLANPGFAEFYKLWKENRTSDEKESLINGVVSGVGTTLVASVALSTQAIQQDDKENHRLRTRQIISDVHAIHKKLDSL